MLLIITAVSALVPSILLIWYFWARDVQREPARVLLATFGLGVLSVIPVLLFALPVSLLIKQVREPFALGALEAFLTAAVPEEGFKLLVILLYCARHKEFDEPMDGIVYGAIASLGFATLENILYVSTGGLGVAMLRALTAVPGHAFLGGVLGYYVGQAKFHPARRAPLILTGYGLAVLLHGLYDFPLLALKNFDTLKLGKPPSAAFVLILITLGALVFEWAWVVSRVRRLRVDQLHVMAVRAVMAGTAPPPGVLTAAPATLGARIAAWLMLLSGGLLASLGGLVALVLLAVVIFSPADKPDEAIASLWVGGLLGVLPFGVGLALFAAGLKRLGAKGPISPYVNQGAAAPRAA